MNRREFVKSAIGSAVAAVLLPDIFLPRAAEASALRITDPGLRFLAMDRRRSTDTIILHHVGGTDGEVSAATMHQWHLNRGWAGLGYHFVVHKNGMIERGRPQDMIGAHCWQHNDASIGINLVGNFDMAEPTTAQLDSAALLISQLSRYYHIRPHAIQGHRDFNATLCPGANLYAKLPALRMKVAKLSRIR